MQVGSYSKTLIIYSAKQSKFAILYHRTSPRHTTII